MTVYHTGNIMRLDLANLLMNPFILVFLVVSIGLLIGSLSIKRFNLGSSGTLFIGLVIGWVVYQRQLSIVKAGELAAGYEQANRMINEGIIHSNLFDIALIFFVASIGLLAAKDLMAVLKEYGVKFIALGLIITLVGAATTFGFAMLIKNMNTYEIIGVYTGALTSSPGLGAALETANSHASNTVNEYEQKEYSVQQEILAIIDPSGSLTPENTKSLTSNQCKTYIMNASASVGVGHAIGYPFGVIMVILSINLIFNFFKINVDEEKLLYAKNMDEIRKKIKSKEVKETPFNIVPFVLTCLFGYLFGSIQINIGPLGYFSLGNTGGVLIIGLILGYIGNVGPLSFRMDPKFLTLIRELSLSFFLGIVGLNYGYKALNALLGSGLIVSLLSIMIAVISIAVGVVVGRYIFKLNWIILLGALCGGMTSTPGLGAAIEAMKSDEPATGYGATYPFALIGMILFTIIIHTIPIV